MNQSYRPDVDGLRAMAILAVLAFHSGLGLPGGFVGVDVFFVISGYLITSIVQNEIDCKSFSILAFWERRVRRLFPALAVVVAAILMAGWFLLLPDDFRELGQSVVAQTLLAANIYYCRESGYFAAPAEIKPLLHVWSLAVEEQFYVILPPLLILLARTRWRTHVLGLLLIGSLVWSEYSSRHSQSASFYLLPSRAWELLLGVILSLWRGRFSIPRIVAEIGAGLGLALIGAACLGYSSRTTFPGLAALVPCCGTAVILVAGEAAPMGLVPRLLSMRALVVLGLLSYSLYLWHWPLFAFANYLTFAPLSVGARLALIGTSVLFAVVSWTVVERPFRRRTVCATRREVFTAAVLAAVFLLAAGMAVQRQEGLRARFSGDVLDAADGKRDRNPNRGLTHDLPIERLVRQGLPRIGEPHDRRPPVLAVLGDSHGDALMPVIDLLCRELNVPTVAATRSATVPLFCGASESDSGKREFQQALRDQLESSDSIRHVLLVGRWAHHRAEVMSAENVDRTVAGLTSSGKKLWVLRQVPGQRTDVPRALALAALWRRDLAKATCTVAEYRVEQAQADALFARSRPIAMIDPQAAFFPNGEACRLSAGGRPLFTDEHHLSATGAVHLASLLRPMFAEIARAQDGR